MKDTPLETFFAPDPHKGIVIFGATDQLDSTGQKKLGQVMAENIANSFVGNIYYINPKRDTVLGSPAYKCVKDLPTVPDLSIVVTPASAVPSVIEECADGGIPSAVVLAAGFQEAGEKGIALSKKVKAIAQGRTRIIGPNCFGVASEKLNGTFSREKHARGTVGIITQSGGVVCGPLDMDGEKESVLKISRAASVGSMLDVTWKELIESFGDDPGTKSILLYVESVGENAPGFISAARKVSKKKLIVALKAGKTEGAVKAAASHTGSLAGDDKIFDEACRLAGIIRAEDLQEAEQFLEFAKQPLPLGNRLVMLTNGGGPIVLATDQLLLHGGTIPSLSSETLERLNATMPVTWSHANPIDIIGDATSERYRVAIESALAEKNSDGVLITYVPVAMSDPTDIARIIIEESAKYPEKPIAVSFTGQKSVAKAKQMLSTAGLAVFDSPDVAARIFAKLAQRQKLLNEEKKECRHFTLCRGCPHSGEDCVQMGDSADKLLLEIAESGRTILTEHEAKKILGAYCIPVGETFIANNSDEAAEIAEKIGYPVVLKLHSTTLTHKSDVGGVELNLKNDKEVEGAFERIHSVVASEHFEGVNVQKMETIKGEEVLIGSKTDPSFGTIVVFGMGGTRAEFFKDFALTVLPITTDGAKNLICRTKISQILENGWRESLPANVEKLEDVIVAFAHFLETHPEIAEVDINPLIVSNEKVIALDARIILRKRTEK